VLRLWKNDHVPGGCSSLGMISEEREEAGTFMHQQHNDGVTAASALTESRSERKTVQEYIDETPFWADGTRLASTPMTSMQWRIWGLATAGKFFEGLVVLGRFSIPKSGHWLVHRGRIEQAERELAKLLRREPPYPNAVKLLKSRTEVVEGNAGDERPGNYRQLFKGKTLRATILASAPWFLQDLGTYGIGIFTPTILASVLGHDAHYTCNVADIIHHDMMAAKGAALIDILLLAGIVAAVMLADVAGRIRLQVIGFMGCAAGLAMAALSLRFQGEMVGTFMLFAGFMLFNFMNNLGPNAMTYLIAGEVFPTAIRGKGAGLAASFSKIGAVATAFLFPILLADLGTEILLGILVGTSLLGALLTWLFRIETAGVNLERVGHDTA